MSRSSVLGFLAVVAWGLPGVAIGGSLYAGPSIQYVHSSSDLHGSFLGGGGFIGYDIPLGEIGVLGFEGDISFPLTRGMEGPSCTDWALTSATGSVTYRTPGRAYLKLFLGYGNGWFDHDSRSRYDSTRDDGSVAGGAIGYRIDDGREILFNTWIVGEHFGEAGDHEGYVFRTGVSYLVRY